MQLRRVRIVGTGKYLPEQEVTDEELDRRLNVPPGWVSKATGVGVRHYASGAETSSFMGARAAEAALADAGLTFADIDCLVCTSGTKEQPLPSTAVFIQQAMGEQDSGVPAFDMDATCLSFLNGLDVISYMVDAGRYKRVLLVATEIASKGLNWSNKESAALFGDGAAAVIIERSAEGESSQIVHASLKTYSRGARFSEIAGGGTRMHASNYVADQPEPYLFHMDGQAIFRMASRLLPAFIDDMLQATGNQMKDFNLVIPHQGSAMAIRLIRKKLGIEEDRFMDITRNHGNTIAASIPMGLHEAIKQQRIERGDRVLMIGTAAGLSLGGLIFDY
ncbi:MAG TPA: beta-ketoacyl-ACP synthase III [Paenibacillus sp.]|uniref:beta-ketoacyl-ACP synthase III n=1 Tax=Paenibacillus TaxID=44249 RepID=UPI000BA16A9E|nr:MULTISPECIES: beta-ketoacyl-ACP synthase III [Paenibacillus]OZQ64136.1 3-oxoacyl-ACP synthase [Paenibacillus taichungensis]HBU84225.1 beta-ketoacyl-ACP synthase III [Paenibacillus sp.]